MIRAISALMKGQSKIWTLVNHLSPLVAHPSIFKKEMESRKKKSNVSQSRYRP